MNLRSEWHFLLLVGIDLFFYIISIPKLCADANFEVNTISIYARNYDFLSVAIKKINTVLIIQLIIFPCFHPLLMDWEAEHVPVSLSCYWGDDVDCLTNQCLFIKISRWWRIRPTKDGPCLNWGSRHSLAPSAQFVRLRTAKTTEKPKNCSS